jgi:glycosyltransferase involved in cell wall biosynthesis
MADSTSLPLISIVIPSYNQARFLPEALESIFRQGYPRAEVVVMDGGSTDDSVAVIESYADRLAYWQSERDGGQSAAINAGMRQCTGDLVAWLNSDDFYWGDCLWSVARAYLAYPGRGLYVGNGLRYDQRAGRYSPFVERHMAFNRDALLYGPDYILQPSTFFLRKAWEEAGGLNPQLLFCMDWDIFLRVARSHAVVLLNEFLGVSREYEETKTRSGKLKRAFEIARMIQSHSGQELTTGSLVYMLGTLHDLAGGSILGEVRMHLGRTLASACEHFSVEFGGGHWTPESSDRQDRVHVDVAAATAALPPLRRSGVRGQESGVRNQEPGQGASLLTPDFCLLTPEISVIIPCSGNHPHLEETLLSVLNQGYPRLEMLAVGRGFTDRVPDAIQKYRDQIAWDRAAPACGAARALGQGLERAAGEVVGWLQPGDLLTAGALAAIGQAFADDPELDAVYANAAYVDSEGRPTLADHGPFRSGFLYGTFEKRTGTNREFPFNYAVPQPTFFFRRRMLESHGFPDPAYPLTFEYDLFVRFARSGKVKKLERTQALCRVSESEDPARWNAVLAELYQHNRRHWPRPWTREFRLRLRDFFRGYLTRKFREPVSRLKGWAIKAVVALAATTRLFNPERWWASGFPVSERPIRLQVPPPRFKSAPVPLAAMQASAGGKTPSRRARGNFRYSSLVCAPHLPTHPGKSGAEERGYQLLRRLMELSTVQFFAHHAAPSVTSGRRLGPVDVLYTPATMTLLQPDRVSLADRRPRLRTRLASALRRWHVPIFGPRCPLQVTEQFCHVRTFARPALQEALNRQQPDFLFVMPQTNPVGLTLGTETLPTRLVLLANGLEMTRVRQEVATRRGVARLALSWEISRARWYERHNLCCFDGVVVPSTADRQQLFKDYNYPEERILVMPQGIEAAWWGEVRRAPAGPIVVFRGDLKEPANRLAVVRLLESIWPRVRQRRPDARLWLVGLDGPLPVPVDQAAGVEILKPATDVRACLGRAALACLPLPGGSAIDGSALEMLAAGVPLVTTPELALDLGVAVEGSCPFLTGQSDEELADAVCRLLTDASLAEQLGEEGQEFARDRSWERCLAALGDWLQDLATLPRLLGRLPVPDDEDDHSDRVSA